MTSDVTRRRFLLLAGAAASMTVLGPWSSSGVVAQTTTPFVRRDVGAMSASDPILVSYRKAIKAMKALPASDPRSWTYQAAIHGTTLAQTRTAWNTCEHGTYFFWSWHRMYLYWFERIVRQMSKNTHWALPYWNWSSTSERRLPAPFRDPGSELYTANRNPAMNNGTGSLPAGDVNYDPAFSFMNFTTASSSLEGTPHGAVHVDIGGWMGSVPTAAQDPIFYLHHSNIDRLWNLWLAQGGGRTDPLTDATWRTQRFTFFNEKGKQVQMTGCDILRAAQQLHYVYEGEPAQVLEQCGQVRPLTAVQFLRQQVMELPSVPFELKDEPVSIQLDMAKLRAGQGELKGAREGMMLLELEDVEAERQPGVVWDVYVGLPKDAKRDVQGPHFVGTVALFGTGIRNEGKHAFRPARFVFPLHNALAAAKDAESEQLSVTFIPHTVEVEGQSSQIHAQAPVKVGKARIIRESPGARE